jgi:hypothetical protein
MDGTSVILCMKQKRLGLDSVRQQNIYDLSLEGFIDSQDI